LKNRRRSRPSCRKDEIRGKITVCHDPTGASQWNPVEHRLFSEINKHWAGQPLVDYSTVLQLIRQTRTSTGLKLACSLDTRRYSKGIKLFAA
jgi:hypothetical protein